MFYIKKDRSRGRAQSIILLIIFLHQKGQSRGIGLFFFISLPHNGKREGVLGELLIVCLYVFFIYYYAAIISPGATTMAYLTKY
jgi:hypothetical protein